MKKDLESENEWADKTKITMAETKDYVLNELPKIEAQQAERDRIEKEVTEE